MTTNMAAKNELNASISEAKNTQRVVKRAAELFREFLESQNEDNQFESFSKQQLNSSLTAFYASARKNDGSELKMSSLYSIKYGIAKYLKDTCNIDITRDLEFSSSSDSFKNRLTDLKKKGRGSIDHKTAISPDDLQKLHSADNDAFNVATPCGLQNYVWFNVMYFLCRKENLRQMTKETFAVDVDSSGRRFVYKTADEEENNSGSMTEDTAAQRRMYESEQPNDPWCPVATFENYISRLHPEIDCLWQKPSDSFSYAPDGLWYCNAPHGKNFLGCWMSRISTIAKLSQRYTNHCIRATLVTAHDHMRMLRSTMAVDTNTVPTPDHMEANSDSNENVEIKCTPVDPLDKYGNIFAYIKTELSKTLLIGVSLTELQDNIKGLINYLDQHFVIEYGVNYAIDREIKKENTSDLEPECEMKSKSIQCALVKTVSALNTDKNIGNMEPECEMESKSVQCDLVKIVSAMNTEGSIDLHIKIEPVNDGYKRQTVTGTGERQEGHDTSSTDVHNNMVKLESQTNGYEDMNTEDVFSSKDVQHKQICQNSYSHNNTQKLHMRRNTGENFHKYKSKIYVNAVREKEKSYSNEICSKSISHENSLGLHRQTHSVQRIVCKTCGKQIVMRHYKNNVKRNYSRKKDHVCSKCGKRFISEKYLKVHQCVHTTDRPHKCSFCRKSFSSKNRHTRHENMHKPLRYFKCDLCRIVFKEKKV